MIKNSNVIATILGGIAAATLSSNALAEPSNPLTPQSVSLANTLPLTLNVTHGSNSGTAGNQAWADSSSTTTYGNLWGMNVAYADLEVTQSGTYQINASSDLMHPAFTLWNAGSSAIGTWNANHVFGQTSSATELVSGNPGRTFTYQAHAYTGTSFTTEAAAGGTGTWAIPVHTVNPNGTSSGDTIIGNSTPETTSLALFLNAGHYLLGVGGACPGGIAGGASACPEVGTKGFKAVGVTVSAVPVPAAVWLFGSALAGMGIIGRRKDTATAAF